MFTLILVVHHQYGIVTLSYPPLAFTLLDKFSMSARDSSDFFSR